MSIILRIFFNFFILFATFIPVAFCQASPSATWATVERVIDGDTLWVTVKKEPLRERIKVRLLGIDALEITDGEKTQKDILRLHTSSEKMFAGGGDAKQFLIKKLPKGTKVKLIDDVQPLDQYGRRLSYLYTKDGDFINKTLILNGLAGLLVYAPNEAKAEELHQALQTAKHTKAGLWGKGFTLTERWKK